MGKFHLLSMKGTLVGIFITLILVLMIPVLFLLNQQKLTSHPSAISEVSPTPPILPASRGQATIAGYIYHDNNLDGERQAEEKPFANVKIQMKELKEGEETHKVQDATTDSYGYFSYHFAIDSQNTYMVSLVLPKGYTTNNVNPIIISDMQPNTQRLVEFGLVPVGGFVPSPTRRPTPRPTTELSPTP